MTVQLAMYKGKGNLFNTLIRWWTNSKYSHCELVVDGLCYSSSGMDKGVRCKEIDLNSGNWDLIDLDWVDGNQVIDYFKLTDHYNYGYIGLITAQVFNRGNGQSEAPFCSEWCADACGIPNACSLSPNTLLNLISWLNTKPIK